MSGHVVVLTDISPFTHVRITLKAKLRETLISKEIVIRSLPPQVQTQFFCHNRFCVGF
jgi:hypothetical protein